MIMYFAIFIVLMGMFLCFLRMIIGPSLADRVISLDLSVNMLISAIAIYSVIQNQFVYIDVIIALALIIFLGTVSFSKLIEWQSKRKSKRKSL